MPQQIITAFNISQKDYDLMKDASSVLKIVINYYTDPPVGYEILLVNESSVKVICARPCPMYYPAL